MGKTSQNFSPSGRGVFTHRGHPLGEGFHWRWKSQRFWAALLQTEQASVPPEEVLREKEGQACEVEAVGAYGACPSGLHASSEVAGGICGRARHEDCSCRRKPFLSVHRGPGMMLSILRKRIITVHPHNP